MLPEVVGSNPTFAEINKSMQREEEIPPLLCNIHVTLINNKETNMFGNHPNFGSKKEKAQGLHLVKEKAKRRAKTKQAKKQNKKQRKKK